MDSGTRLAVEAVILGLLRSGALSDHALTVILDELRMAARRSRDQLHDYEADCIEVLATSLRNRARSPFEEGAERSSRLTKLAALVRSAQPGSG